MFYKLIEKKRDEWLNSKECSVSELIQYIEHRGMMRDAQLEAIKTYLFLKIACKKLSMTAQRAWIWQSIRFPTTKWCIPRVTNGYL